MRRLWIADVHANLPAFEAVLRDAGAVDEVVFLGDVRRIGLDDGFTRRWLAFLRSGFDPEWSREPAAAAVPDAVGPAGQGGV